MADYFNRGKQATCRLALHGGRLHWHGYHPPQDASARGVVAKWILLVIAAATFGVLAWAIVVTYVFAAAAALMAWDFILKARRLVNHARPAARSCRYGNPTP
jgi:hypothetical protein